MNQVHFLDVGKSQYGDCILLKLGDRTILIDGGNPGSYYSSHPHDSIPDQLKKLLGGAPPYRVSLLIVTHAHQDHIGCLPKMIHEGILEADWALIADPHLGWGAPTDGETIDTREDLRVQKVLAAMREEPIYDARDDVIEQFLNDAYSLRSKYIQMLTELEEAGTTVIRFQGENETDELLEEFSDIGMKILGPNQLMLLRCTQVIEQHGRDLINITSNAIQLDSSRNEIDLYRYLCESSDSMGLDAGGLGAALNCMSLVLLFEIDNIKLLMTGDMQFTDTGIHGDNSIDTEMEVLRQYVSNEAPFDLYKIAHHGSSNAFNENIFDELNGTVNFAISTGRLSGHHPSRSVLQFLKSNVDDILWSRTDKNGMCSFDFETNPPEIEIDRGILCDWQMNHVDMETTSPKIPKSPLVPTPPAPAPPVPATPTPLIPAQSMKSEVPQNADHEIVEVITRVPHRQTKVTITIAVDPPETLDQSGSPQAITSASPALPQPKNTLAFVTDQQRLASNIGASEMTALLTDLQQNGHSVINLQGYNSDPQSAARLLQIELAKGTTPDGVVILGGYDVIPSCILDVLPANLRQQIGTHTGDPDNFFVWSDELYGDLDADGVAEIPVSRIPDGNSADLLQKAIHSHPPQQVSSRQGVRNVKRPFADEVFNVLSGSGEMLSSSPAIYTQVPQLSHDYIYLMLHGSYRNATEFHGEGTQNGSPAIRIDNIPNVTSSIVFCGCCWGALIVDKPAVYASQGTVTARTARNSIPMKFLAAGANAFIGCTGVHYSPIQSPYKFFGGPLHESFWQHIVSGTPPAQALFNAKKDYIEGMFHDLDDAVEHAIEYKILRQFTCLGLGW